MTLGSRVHRYGARPVIDLQAGAVPGSLPRGSPPHATGGPLVLSCGARRQTRKATGHRNIRQSEKRQTGINIMHWNAEGALSL